MLRPAVAGDVTSRPSALLRRLATFSKLSHEKCDDLSSVSYVMATENMGLSWYLVNKAINISCIVCIYCFMIWYYTLKSTIMHGRPEIIGEMLRMCPVKCRNYREYPLRDSQPHLNDLNHSTIYHPTYATPCPRFQSTTQYIESLHAMVEFMETLCNIWGANRWWNRCDRYGIVHGWAQSVSIYCYCGENEVNFEKVLPPIWTS